MQRIGVMGHRLRAGRPKTPRNRALSNLPSVALCGDHFRANPQPRAGPRNITGYPFSTLVPATDAW